MNIPNKEKLKKNLYQYIPKDYNKLDYIKENFILEEEEEQNEYLIFPKNKKRRNSISISKIYKKEWNILKNKANTVRSKKYRNGFTIKPSNKGEKIEITAEKIYHNLIEDFSFENNEERVNYLMNSNPFYE